MNLNQVISLVDFNENTRPYSRLPLIDQIAYVSSHWWAIHGIVFVFSLYIMEFDPKRSMRQALVYK